jgi:hypothetical protein
MSAELRLVPPGSIIVAAPGELSEPYDPHAFPPRRSFELVVPMPPNLANSRIHYQLKDKVRLCYYAVLDLHLLGITDIVTLEKLPKIIESEKRKAAKKTFRAAERERDRAAEAGRPQKKVSANLSFVRELEVIQSFSRPLPEEERLPRNPETLERAAIRSTMYVGTAMDDGNAMNRHKWVEDWLVSRKFLRDDRKKCLTWEGIPTQVVRRDGNYRIALTITALD